MDPLSMPSSIKMQNLAFEDPSDVVTYCLGTLEGLQFAHNLEKNHKDLINRLYFIGLTLSRWGYSMGLVGDVAGGQPGVSKPNRVMYCFEYIKDLLEQVQLESKEFERANPDSKHENTGTMPYERGLSPAESAFREFVLEKMHQYATKYRKAEKIAPWTVYSYEALEHLGLRIGDWLQTFIRLVPLRVTVPTKTLIEEEVKKAQDNVLPMLRELNEYDMKDEDLREAIAAEIYRRGRTNISLEKHDDSQFGAPYTITRAGASQSLEGYSSLDVSRLHLGKSYPLRIGKEDHDTGNLDEDVEEDEEESADVLVRSSGTYDKELEFEYADIQGNATESLARYKDMAAKCRSERRWEEAEVWERKVLRISTENFNEWDPWTLTSMIHLSSTIKALSGRISQGDRSKEADNLERQIRESLDRMIHELPRFAMIDTDDLVAACRNYQRWTDALDIERLQLIHRRILIQDEKLAVFLLDDRFLKSAYRQTLQELGIERFYSFNNQALSEFFVNLRLESREKDEEHWELHQASHFPASRDRRIVISERIVKLIMNPEMLQHEMNRKALHEFTPQLEWIAETKSLEMLERCLDSVLHPVSTIESALQYRNCETIRKLLETSFDTVAQNEYKWLQELSEVGYSYSDIAELLYEQAVDAPWIFFEPKKYPEAEMNVDLHLKGCIHGYTATLSAQSGCSNCSTIDRQLDLTSPTGLTSESPSSQNEADVKEMIEKLCGLAGVTPSSRERQDLDGVVEFHEQKSVATISFDEEPELLRPLKTGKLVSILRMMGCLKRLRLAVANAQAADLCCESFTIIRLRNSDHEPNSETKADAEVCRIPFRLVENISKQIGDLFVSKYSAIRSTAWTVLQFVTQEAGECPFSEERDILHVCALATQILCFGFLSYIHAHVGPVRPCFLDTPLKQVQLLGVATSTETSIPLQGGIAIEASLRSLTCFSGVVQSPVFVFQRVESDFPERGYVHTVSESLEPSLPLTEKHACDLLTTLEDLIDTWGPAHLLISAEDNSPFAVKIGSGIIYREKAQTDKLHWSSNISPEGVVRISLDLSKMYLIGTRVTVNDRCDNSEIERCRQDVSSFFMPLGTYQPYWETVEREFGIQGGQYIFGQYVVTAHKFPGNTLKQQIMGQSDGLLMTCLDDLWGVQVSFCTHVARRVSLREMVADLLPVFEEGDPTFCDKDTWRKLKKLNLMETFQKGDIKQFFSNLCEPLNHKVLKMVREILETVQHTGVDREKKYLVVAWPHKKGLLDCLEVPLKDQNSWIEVLADSRDSAAFCYITPKCLETDNHKCKGQKRVWNGEMVLLETAVMAYARDRAALAAMLKDGKHWHFQKMEDLFVVRVQRPVADGVVNLITKRSIVPQATWIRLMAKDRARLREIKRREDPAEEVAVLHLPIPGP